LRVVYLEKTKDIQEIAQFFGKGSRSIISKLVSMKIYEKPAARKENNRTVKTMLRDLEIMLEIEVEGVNLNKKSNLLMLVEAIEERI
jgi:hypothetical protein